MSDELLTATEIADLIGVYRTTWSRWARSGKAPRAIIDKDKTTLWTQSSVAEFLDKLALLDGAVAA